MLSYNPYPTIIFTANFVLLPPRKLSTVHLTFPPTNKRSKSGENPLKSRVYSDFSVEKTVENVKD